MIALSSNDPETNKSEVGEKAVHNTAAVWPLSFFSRVDLVDWVGGKGVEEWIWRVLSSDAVARYNPSGEMEISLIPDCQLYDLSRRTCQIDELGWISCVDRYLCS